MGAQKAQIGFRQPDNPSVICFANATSLYAEGGYALRRGQATNGRPYVHRRKCDQKT